MCIYTAFDFSMFLAGKIRFCALCLHTKGIPWNGEWQIMMKPGSQHEAGQGPKRLTGEDKRMKWRKKKFVHTVLHRLKKK